MTSTGVPVCSNEPLVIFPVEPESVAVRPPAVSLNVPLPAVLPPLAVAVPSVVEVLLPGLTVEDGEIVAAGLKDWSHELELIS